MGPTPDRCLRYVPLLLMAAVLAAIAALSPPGVSGQEDEIRIISQVVENGFPDNITFMLTASSPDPIEEIRVFLKPVGSDRSSYGYLDIEPAIRVSGRYTMSIGFGASHKPPGTLVRYSFEIRDTAGRVRRTEDEEFLYMDNTLDWKEISDGLLTVYYYGDFVEKRAQTVLEASQKTMENMGRLLGIRPTEPIRIVAYSNYRDMARALPFRSQTVREELQTEGQAYANERVLLVLASEATVSGVASHEFTHILVAEAAGRGRDRVPSWLNEGLAEYGNIDPTPHYDWALNYAIFTRRLKPLWHQGDFGGEPDDILIGYGQGKSVVTYLIRTYGDEKIAELMKAFRTVRSTDEVLQKVYGFDQYGLDSEWRQSIGIARLPPRDELDRQAETTPTAEPADEAEPTPVPSPEVQSTPAPVAEETPGIASAQEGGRSTSRSCGAPAGDAAHLPLDIGMLALLGGPLFAWKGFRGTGVGWLVRRLPSTARLKRGRHTFPDGGAH